MANHLTIGVSVLLLDRFNYPHFAGLLILALSFEGILRPVLYVIRSAREMDRVVAERLEQKRRERERLRALQSRHKSWFSMKEIIKDIFPGHQDDGDGEGTS